MIRFFVNRPDLRYVGKIHEHLVRKGRSGLHLTDATKQLAFPPYRIPGTGEEG